MPKTEEGLCTEIKRLSERIKKRQDIIDDLKNRRRQLERQRKALYSAQKKAWLEQDQGKKAQPEDENAVIRSAKLGEAIRKFYMKGFDESAIIKAANCTEDDIDDWCYRNVVPTPTKIKRVSCQFADKILN